MEEYIIFMDQRIQYCKQANSHKITYRFNTILTKIPVGLFGHSVSYNNLHDIVPGSSTIPSEENESETSKYYINISLKIILTSQTPWKVLRVFEGPHTTSEKHFPFPCSPTSPFHTSVFSTSNISLPTSQPLLLAVNLSSYIIKSK